MRKIVVLLLVVLLESEAYCSGFALNFQSVYSNSMSRAAESTNIHDVSGIWGNPAIMTELGKYEVSLNLNYLYHPLPFIMLLRVMSIPQQVVQLWVLVLHLPKVYQTLQLCLMHMQVLD